MHNALMTELGRLSTIDLSYLVIWVGDVTTSPCARLLSEKFGFATGVVLISGVNSQGERVNFAGNTMPPTAAIKLPSEGAKTLTLLPLYEQGQPVAALPFVQTPVPQLNAIVPGLLNNLMGRLFQAQATVQTITADRELRNNQDREFEESAAADAALAVARGESPARLLLCVIVCHCVSLCVIVCQTLAPVFSWSFPRPLPPLSTVTAVTAPH